LLRADACICIFVVVGEEVIGGEADIEMKNTLPLPRPSDFILSELERASIGNYYDEDEEEAFENERYRQRANPIQGIRSTKDYINSPFHDAEDTVPGISYTRSSESQKSDKSSSQKSDSSQRTVKWKDAADVHFRMVQADAGLTAGKPSTKLWEVNTSGQDGTRQAVKSSSKPIVRVRSKSSRIENFANSFSGLFEHARIAAASAVYGTYDEFGFVDYSTKQFASLREMAGIDASSYINAFKSTTNENFSEGRSGAFMFCSSDHRFVVKTTTLIELKALLSLLPSYISFVKANPNSLLARFIGAHCITMYSTKLYFIVMLNVFPKERLSEKYDLKGSWINRFGNRGDKLTRREKLRDTESIKSVPLYQDNDVQQKICLRRQVALELLTQVEKDTRFLASRRHD
jgi:hypothetical protein